MPSKEYSCPAYIKKRLWLEIIEAAEVVIAKGGGGIRFRPNIEESERLFREKKKLYGKEKV